MLVPSYSHCSWKATEKIKNKITNAVFKRTHTYKSHPNQEITDTFQTLEDIVSCEKETYAQSSARLSKTTICPAEKCSAIKCFIKLI
jgi:hypothetical protein